MITSVLSVLAMLLMGGIGACSAQEALSISGIRAEVGKINADLPKYTKRIQSVLDISLEGTEATYYHDGKNLKKISAKIYGETYNAALDLYFEAELLLFAYRKLNRYDTQVGMKPAPKVVSSEEKRLYFFKGGLAALRIAQTEVSQGDLPWQETEQEIVELAETLKTVFGRQ